MASKTNIMADNMRINKKLQVNDLPIENNFWISRHPFLDESYSNDKGVPTAGNIGLFRYYSMAIWSTPANQYEELLFRLRVPHRWDGVTNPHFVFCTAPSAAETIDDRYQFQIEWQAADVGNLFPDTTQETLTYEVTLVTGENAAWFGHIVAFEFDATTLVSGQCLQARLRRIAATVDEVTAEPVIFHWDTRWKMNKVGSESIQGY